MIKYYIGILFCSVLFPFYPLSAQTLTFKTALSDALQNYASLKAKANYVSYSKELVERQKRQALPDISLSAQQMYGTINNVNGPSYGLKGLSVASSGPVLANQNWNAAFGSLYLANINWDFFSFGKIKQGVKVAQSNLQISQSDLDQETFQQEVRVAAAYLNLLAAQQLTISQQNNLNRAIAIRDAVMPRVINGLNPGVDSSFAVAEVSSARIQLTSSQDRERELATELSRLMGVAPADPRLDSIFLRKIPSAFYDSVAVNLQNHPTLQYYQAQIVASQQQEKYLKTQYFPTISLFTTLQSRASGFGAGYGATNMDDYSGSYLKGVGATRENYLVGVGAAWDLTAAYRLRKEVDAQRRNTAAIEDNYNLAKEQIADQLDLSAQKIKNALTNYAEAPIQVRAANEGYIQKTTLYKNGLATIVDVTQSLYTVNRAETDRDIAFNNVWQALLIKAAAAGDFSIFLNEF